MKTFALLVAICISPTFFCLGQDTWQNYNTGNSGLLTNSVSAILVDKQNNLWGAYAGAGGNGNGVVKFNGTTWTHYSTANSGLPNNDVRAIAVDAQGNLWFACYNAGIVKFNGTSWTPYNVSNSGIAGNDVVTITFDKNNKLWVGCYFSGVSKLDGTTWTIYNKSNAPFPDSNCINTITIGSDNSVWVGMDCAGGLAKFSPLTNTWKSYTPANSEIANHTVTSIFEDDTGKIWLSYLNNFVSSIDGNTWTHYNLKKKIDGFASDKNGDLWGCGRGVFKLVGSNWYETTVDGDIDNYSYVSQSFAIDTEGRFWWSVQGKGIWTNLAPSITSFEHTTDLFKPVFAGKIKWADLDNDLDLDILYCGNDEGSPLTVVYENKGGSFQAKATNLPDVMNGSFATGDYDNDGDLDVLITGSNTIPISRLYRNNGNFSFSLAYPFPGLINATTSWMDLDNDDDLDFLLAGWNDGSDVAKTYVYENKGGVFELLPGTNLPSCSPCSMDWADSNGDGKVDLLISGYGDLPNHETSVYLNNGNKTFTKDASSVLKSLVNGNVTWGDFDKDEDMDALTSGFAADGKAYTLVYENKNGVLHERTDIHITTTAENWWGGTAWADFNNDGNLDILVTGRGVSQAVKSYGFKIFLNNGLGQFAEASDADFPGINESSVDCADYDGDGDVDISFLGINYAGKAVTGIYENKMDEIPRPNIAPAFKITEIIDVDEDFDVFTIQLKAVGMPPSEQTQTVVYSLEALDEENVTATIDASTGKITFSAIPNAFGSTSYRVTANDGQLDNNIFSTNIKVNVNPVNDAPQLSLLGDVVIEFNNRSTSISFTVQDIDQPASQLIVTATSSNNALVKDSNITITGNGEQRTLNIVPESGAFGETIITVRVSNDGLFVERQFKITISNEITAIEKSSMETINLFPNPVLSSLTVSASRQMKGPITIIVSDIRGMEVRRLVTTDEESIIDMTDLSAGVYVLRISDEDQISRPRKIIKSR